MVGFRSLMREAVLNTNESRGAGKLCFYHGIFCGIAFHRVIEHAIYLEKEAKNEMRSARRRDRHAALRTAYGALIN